MKQYLGIFLIAIIFASCTSNFKEKMEEEDGPVQKLSQVIKKEEVQNLKTEISMAAGFLKVNKGSEDFADAEISYTRDKWKPEISFSATGETGKLLITQGEDSDFNFNFDNDDKNKWDIKLNPDIPQDIELQLGAGVSEINLADFNLQSVSIEAGVGEHDINLANTSVPTLNIDAGVGEVSINLTGEWKNDLDAEINGGIGELNMILPKNAGIYLEIDGGLGSVDAPGFMKEDNVYKSENYESAAHILRFEINAGMGSINVTTE